MYKNKKITVLIVARKNSKGLKNKHQFGLSRKKLFSVVF
jgi:hypothetical protein